MKKDKKNNNLEADNKDEKIIPISEYTPAGYFPECLRSNFFTKLSFLLACSVASAAVAVLAENYFFNVPSAAMEREVSDFSGENRFIAMENQSGETAGRVLGETTSAAGTAFASSENFEIKNVRFGGDFAFSGDGTEDLPFKITDVRSETFMTKKQDETKLAITWKTSRMARSAVKYSKSGSADERTVQEDGYGFNHGIIIGKLDASSAYTYTISVKDRRGNEVNSDKYGLYTGTKLMSVFDMISKAAQDVFGWALK